MIDDHHVQPEPRTAAGDHLVSGLGPPYAEALALPVLDELRERGARVIRGAQVRRPPLLRCSRIAEEADAGVGVAGLGPAAEEASGRHSIEGNGVGHQRSPVPRVDATPGRDPPMVM